MRGNPVHAEGTASSTRKVHTSWLDMNLDQLFILIMSFRRHWIAGSRPRGLLFRSEKVEMKARWDGFWLHPTTYNRACIIALLSFGKVKQHFEPLRGPGDMIAEETLWRSPKKRCRHWLVTMVLGGSASTKGMGRTLVSSMKPESKVRISTVFVPLYMLCGGSAGSTRVRCRPGQKSTLAILGCGLPWKTL